MSCGRQLSDSLRKQDRQAFPLAVVSVDLVGKEVVNSQVSLGFSVIDHLACFYVRNRIILIHSDVRQ